MIRTLIVEDDFRVADINSAYVARVEGFEVIGIAASAADGYLAIIKERPDLVLLDLFLPDEHGFELFAKIQQLSRGTKPDVIVITAARDSQSVKDAIQLGAIHFIVKPFTPHQLTERLLAYKSGFSRLSNDHEISQAEVDQTVGMMRGHKLELDEPGSTRNPTTDLILNCLARHIFAMSASEVAEELGISRATAQRYLSQLGDRKLVALELQYGTAGRPINKYRKSKN